MMTDCASCTLFSVQQDSSQCVHTNRPGGLTITKRAFDICGFPAHARILDVACGTGATVNFLANIPGLTAVGLDRSGKALSKACSDLSRLNLLRAEVLEIPLAKGLFDGVFIECAVSIVGDFVSSLLEIRRVLRPGGKAILTDIYLRNPVDGDSRLILNGSTCLAGVSTSEELEKYILTAGFKTLIWEDQTPLLKQWMVEQIFRFGSRSEFLYQLSGGRSHTEGFKEAWSRIRLGYYLAILQKPLAHEILEVDDG